jgi:hypothetical protein
MNNERFKQKMAELEQELDAHIARLTPEGQKEFKQKQNEFNQREDTSAIHFNLSFEKGKSAKRK